ncbi:MAG: pyrroline-5-carboxylate reductase, partial [Planctomycetia bacterium]|nr:pyrroline-5-carboxylate reductase [Planctomycetia bacterium]
MTGTGLRIGFLGAGRMASALARAWVNAGIVVADSVLASDPSSDARDAFRLPATPDNRSVVAVCDLLVLAVKPQMMAGVCGEVRDEIARCRPLVVSVAAGVTLGRLAADLGSDTRLIRVMPNTPTLIGKGMAGYSLSSGVTDAQKKFVQSLLAATGKAIEIPEELQNALTGTSGSGPAYFFRFVEAMVDGAVAMGLSRKDATTLTIQTIVGAAALLDESGDTPTRLREKVTSLKGATAEALAVFDEAG